jgi:LPXTG-motif cell wall-anchored protein
MKKLIITITILFGLSLTTFADGGLFHRGSNARNGQASGYTYFNAKAPSESVGLMSPGLPPHGSDDNQPAPLGSGIAVLMGLGAAYLVGKRRKE